MELLNIKEYTKEWKNKIKAQIQESGVTPILSIYCIGDRDAASERYVRNKMRDCAEVGIEARLYEFDNEATTKQIVKKIVNDEAHGIIVQMPVPKQIDMGLVKKVIPKEKDVDGFNLESKFKCCTPGGIIKYLEDCGFCFEGANAVVIGRSDIVGKPMARYLLEKNCTVTVCHSKTNRSFLYTLLHWADLVVCAVGKRGIFRSSETDPKTVIIDVGINIDENGKLCGDVIDDGGNVNITPVPGGVGLLTRCMLLENVLHACLGD